MVGSGMDSTGAKTTDPNMMGGSAVAGWNKPNMLGNLNGLIKKMRDIKTIPKRPKNPMPMVNKDAYGKRRGLVGRIAKMAGASKVAGLSAMAGGATTNKGKIPKMPEGSGVKGALDATLAGEMES